MFRGRGGGECSLTICTVARDDEERDGRQNRGAGTGAKSHSASHASPQRSGKWFQKPSFRATMLRAFDVGCVGVDSLTKSSPSYQSRTLRVSLRPTESSAAQTPPNASRDVRIQESTAGLPDAARRSRKKHGGPARARNHSSIPSEAADLEVILKSPRGRIDRVRYAPSLTYNPIA